MPRGRARRRAAPAPRPGAAPSRPRAAAAGARPARTAAHAPAPGARRSSRSATSSSTSRSAAASCSARSATVQAVDGVSFDDPARRDARPRRRVGLRQDDGRAAAPAPHRADVGHDPVRRHGHHARSAARRSSPTGGGCRSSSRTRTRRLDPRTPIGDSIGEGLRIHGIGTPAERREQGQPDHGPGRARSRTTPAATRTSSRGGQRQRIGIARALVLEPDLVVCDEPVSALDVSIQAQVLNLLKELQRELGLTYLFIAHNMGVVEHISDRVAVMYLGRIAELADRRELFRKPEHPYTQALMSAIPVPDPELRRKRVILTRRRARARSTRRRAAASTRAARCARELGDPAICATDGAAAHRRSAAGTCAPATSAGAAGRARRGDGSRRTARGSTCRLAAAARTRLCRRAERARGRGSARGASG